VQPADIDARRTSRHNRDLRGEPENHRVEPSARLGRVTLGVVQR
jgi:hypothetical protein